MKRSGDGLAGSEDVGLPVKRTPDPPARPFKTPSSIPRAPITTNIIREPSKGSAPSFSNSTPKPQQGPKNATTATHNVSSRRGAAPNGEQRIVAPVTAKPATNGIQPHTTPPGECHALYMRYAPRYMPDYHGAYTITASTKGLRGDRKYHAVRAALPIFSARERLIAEIKANQTVIMVGETGSGKTTQLAQVRERTPGRPVGGVVFWFELINGK